MDWRASAGFFSRALQSVAVPATGALLCLGLGAPPAALAADPDLAGTWTLATEWDNVPSTSVFYHQSDVVTFTRTAPDTYTVTVGTAGGGGTSDIAISGSSFTLWECGASAGGQIYSDKARGTCPKTSGHWEEPWHFHFKDGQVTATGTFQEFNADGSTTEEPYGTFTASLVSAPASAGLAVAVSTAEPKLAVGAEIGVRVTVSAVGADLHGISLGDGLTASSKAAVVSQSPAGLSGFDLREGASRSFDFTVKGTKPASLSLRVHATATTTSGIVHGSAEATLNVVEAALSVLAVTRGSAALSADVRLHLADAWTDASGCDPKASYDFSDPEVASAKEIAPCTFELTFEDPGTGIYHIAFTATDRLGTAIPVSLDQYGDTVDGRFTLIIDSCSDPEADVADVDALIDAEAGVCDVTVGDWDTDATGLAANVIADAERSPILDVDPIPIESVDPSDWPTRGPAAADGWIPTGTAKTKVLETSEKKQTGAGETVALVDRLVIRGNPYAWDGAGSMLAKEHLEDVPPATVISAHGLWYTPNGMVRVPAGDQVTTYVPIGTSMANDLGQDVDTGNVHGDDLKYRHIYTTGQLLPNFTFIPPDFPAGHHVTSPTTPTTLNALLKANEGDVWIAACAPVFVPAGETSPRHALANLPIHTPGSNETDGYATVTVAADGSADGQVQTPSAGANP